MIDRWILINIGVRNFEEIYQRMSYIWRDQVIVDGQMEIFLKNILATMDLYFAVEVQVVLHGSRLVGSHFAKIKRIVIFRPKWQISFDKYPGSMWHLCHFDCLETFSILT